MILLEHPEPIVSPKEWFWLALKAGNVLLALHSARL
jgi:hypothetical protein